MAFEIPIYRFRPEVPFEEAKMVLRLNGFLADAPGFLSRKTCYELKASTWIDFVERETREHALGWFRRFLEN